MRRGAGDVASIATRAALSGIGSKGVSSSNTSSEATPRASVATMLEPEVCSSGLPEPASAPASASTAPRWPLLAALTTASARRASAARRSQSSRSPSTGSTPKRLTASAFAGERTSPRTP